MNFLLLLIFVPPLAIAYALVIFGRRSFGRMWVSSACWPLGLALLVPVAMLVWGMLMNYSGPIDTEPRWHLHVLTGLDGLAILFDGYLVWRYAGFRLLVSIFLSAVIWLTMWADVISSCLLSND